MHQQHVIDWWKHRGYRVTVLTDWSLMCVKNTVYASTDLDRINDTIERRHRAKWLRQPAFPS